MQNIHYSNTLQREMLQTKLSSMANPTPAPVKVVVIEYHHIQTDVSNFKSVVQSLTGKHSCSVPEVEAEADDSSFAGERSKRRRVNEDRRRTKSCFEKGERCGDGSCNRNYSASTLLKGMSFKDLDLDGLLTLELPSMEDLSWIWTD